MSEALFAFLRLNLAMGLAVAVVLALRLPLRRLCGAQAAYGLWSLVPLAALAMLAPARTITVHPAAPVTVAPVIDMAPLPALPAPAAAFDAAPLLVALWLAGAAASVLWLLRRQAQFARAVAAGRAGPAVVGVLRPRIVLPADFPERYTAPEQRVILAHERSHIARHDSRINALVALARCLAWFNPLTHLAAHYLRVDQELACDARVIAAHPQARRAYAEAMLKAQLAARPLPLGCYWPAASAHPLAQRIALLARRTPSPARRRLGMMAVALLGMLGAGAAWAARPPQLVLAPELTPAPAIAVSSSAPPASPRHAEAVPAPPRPAKAEAEPVPEAAAPPPEPQPAAAPEPEPVADPAAAAPFQPRVMGAAQRSFVEPGSAVRVVASATDPDGAPLVTDLTAFGSQSLYRSGRIVRSPGSRYSLFTSVRQEGERLWVTASLGAGFWPGSTGTIALTSGETGQITLPRGQVVTVTATLRPETAQEMAEGARALQAPPRMRLARFAIDPFQCGRRGAVC